MAELWRIMVSLISAHTKKLHPSLTTVHLVREIVCKIKVRFMYRIRIVIGVVIDRIALAKLVDNALGSVHPPVCLCVWVYPGHIIHHYIGIWATCAPGRRNMHHSGAICTTVHKGDYVFRGSALPSAAKSNKSHYQFKVFVCVCNQWAYADNRAYAVDRRFIYF